MSQERIIVYTMITGNYDSVQPVIHHNTAIDYICLTDSKFKGIVPKPWKHMRLPPSSLNFKDLARFCKIHPHLLFPQYEQSVWVDGNISICGNIKELVDSSLLESNIALYDHWGRNNIFQESIECALIGHDYAWTLHKQMKKYKREGFKSTSLYETNVLIRRHCKNSVIKSMQYWWEEYETGGKRDQYSFTYSVAKAGESILSLGQHDPRLIQEFFKYHQHKINTSKSVKLIFKRLINRIYIAVTGWHEM